MTFFAAFAFSFWVNSLLTDVPMAATSMLYSLAASAKVLLDHSVESARKSTAISTNSFPNISSPERQWASQKRLGKQELKDMLQYGHLELADKMMDPGYIQHNPNVPQRREDFKQFMISHVGGGPVEIKPVWTNPPALALADGPSILMMWNVNDKDPSDPTKTYTRSHFDLLRIENRLVKEHWDEARIERKKVSVDVSVLNSYPGRYALAPNFDVAVTMEDGHLATQGTGQPKLALAAESNTTFFLENADLAVEFVKDGEGKVTGLIVHQAGQNMKAAIH
jgi:predicted SnoaL-like aldol condensation-catalyzing enzyme